MFNWTCSFSFLIDSLSCFCHVFSPASSADMSLLSVWVSVFTVSFDGFVDFIFPIFLSVVLLFLVPLEMAASLNSTQPQFRVHFFFCHEVRLFLPVSTGAFFAFLSSLHCCVYGDLSASLGILRRQGGSHLAHLFSPKTPHLADTPRHACRTMKTQLMTKCHVGPQGGGLGLHWWKTQRVSRQSPQHVQAPHNPFSPVGNWSPVVNFCATLT